MRRSFTLARVVSLLMAMLILFGTSSAAIASIFCPAEACPKKEVKTSCCPEQKASESENCCCKITSLPDLDARANPLVWTGPSFDLVLSLPIVSVSFGGSYALDERILFSGDLPPPAPPVRTDQDRAPPAV